jgi:hypothetical protein
VDAVSELLHRNGALACFDYAGAGSHVPISMAAPPGRPLAYKDAVALTPHKMLGGPGSCGLLVAARDLFHHVPTVPGVCMGCCVDPQPSCLNLQQALLLLLLLLLLPPRLVPHVAGSPALASPTGCSISKL